MPLVSFHRVKRTVLYFDEGTQFIHNVLTLPTSPDTATLQLGSVVYTRPGVYAIFDYSNSTAGTPVVGDIAQVIIDDSALVGMDAGPLVNDTARKIITCTLTPNSSYTQGTQYVDGNLNISASTTIHLSIDIFGGPGTYTLFTFGTFTGSITNITIVPPAGRVVDTGVSPNGCAISGSTITVTLL